VRNRRVLSDRDAGRAYADLQPDPSQVGGVAEAPFVRLPDPARLFATRAERLRQLADGHVLGDYLRFLAAIVAAQAGAVASLPPTEPVPERQLALGLEHGMPPLSTACLEGNGDFAASRRWLLDHIDLAAAPPQAQQAAAEVRAMTEPDVEALAADIMQGAYPADRLGEALFVAAALQVHLARLARTLDPARLARQNEGVCPVCGGAPVSSVVVGWTQASKARYCACSLCGTLWNHVRIRCTACGSTEGIAYYSIEDGPKTVGVETCAKCRSYIKHLQQHEDTALEPLADDVASYAVDLLARELDFRRASINPLFMTG
jgi:FdhE protein